MLFKLSIWPICISCLKSHVYYHFAMCEATIYLFMPLLANLHNYAYYLVQECYYVCCPLLIDCLMVYQNRKGLCKLISINVQVSSLYVQL